MNENVKEKKPKRIPKIFKNFQVLKHPFALFFYVLIMQETAYWWNQPKRERLYTTT